MSRVWAREALESRCGCCRQRIVRGQPFVTVQVPGLERKFIRCGAWLCAGEPVPDDLPPVPEHKSVAELAPMTPARIVAEGSVLPLDYTHRRLGEREPGDDDE